MFGAAKVMRTVGGQCAGGAGERIREDRRAGGGGAGDAEALRVDVVCG